MTKFKRFGALLVALILCLSLLTLTACPGPDDTGGGGGGGGNENGLSETRPLTMSIQDPDGLFNPFFSTSAMDSNIISMTQVGMLSSDKEGKEIYGDNEPVVVKDFKIDTASDNSYTEYSFIIKNGIKFSDGSDLTIKDVLFNLYVYLDPVYTGSSTIYSTDIVGLQAYRQQNPDANDKDAASFERQFMNKAKQRRTNLIEFMQAYGRYTPPAGSSWEPREFSAAEISSFQDDYRFVVEQFRKELEADWNSANVEAYQDEGFTQKWQVYLYQDGQQDLYLKDEATGKYVLTKEGKKQIDPDKVSEWQEVLDQYLEEFKLDPNKEENIKAWAIDQAFANYFPLGADYRYDDNMYKKENVAATIARTNANEFSEVVMAWATADEVITQFIADAKSAQFADGDHPVATISGITSSAAELSKVTVDFQGNNLGEPHDILKIKINGIDPKAKWNFSFTVAPMSYYSGTYNGHNYIQEFNAATGNFGFPFGDKGFFDNVINAPSKVGLPRGAGVYMASTINGNVANSGSEFYNNNIVYYERNPYFYTLFGDDTSKNAKIKYFRYKVVGSDQVINSIINGDIDIGEPNATPRNMDTLKDAGIAYDAHKTNGYGYVGINPRFVSDVHVRRAIMKAMDKQLIKDNYYQSLCEIIERPMSTTSWAYPQGVPTYSTTYEDVNGQIHEFSYKYENDDLTGAEIETLLRNVGYVKDANDVFFKNNDPNTRLSYKFTIAGSSTDHPAYAMFVKAANLLNKHGFDIKVVTSQSALQDLAAGKLAVWAAAWSSTIDPDMYQVYHMDSNASSVNNWGYPQIKANPSTYSFEYEVITRLSTLIDEGRESNEDSERAVTYAKALDLVMELAVEMPTYQRNDMTAYKDTLVDRNTMTPKDDLSAYNGLLSRIWELNYLPQA